MGYFSAIPEAQGLYDPSNEHDACGVAMVATLNRESTHSIVEEALTALRNLEHRGASGAEINSGDGAGILTCIPDEFFRAVLDFKLPEAGKYAAGIVFLPEGFSAYERLHEIAQQESVVILGWRELPINANSLGKTALSTMPKFTQIFLAGVENLSDIALDRLAFCFRKRVERELSLYFPSLSSRTIVYKGMLTTGQLEEFFPDLSDVRFTSPLALVHSRFSTNTFPSWPLAHPYRFIAHNGEINTVRGNRNWMAARESLLESDLIPGDLRRLFPIVDPAGSDSASFDEVLELLYLGGRSLPHSILMMIPEAWENHGSMNQEQRDFYRFHASLMEPWDGPACVTFTDGKVVGAVLDRNGLRPSRYWVTEDGMVILASEVGVLDKDPSKIVRKGRLQPGRMFLVDIDAGRIIEDTEIKVGLARSAPYSDWLHAGIVRLTDLPPREHIIYPHSSVLRRQRAFGYTEEELRILIAPMAKSGAEPIGSMGTDTPIAALSAKPRLLFDYFSQLFAQVTNPPLDAIREELVTSLGGSIGPEHNLLDPGPASCRQISLAFPVIDNDELSKIIHINADGNHPGLSSYVVRGLFPLAHGGAGMAARISEIQSEVSSAIKDGARIIILSDRDGDADSVPIPSLLLTSAVHHHLIREKTRTKVGLVVESGEVREVHHVALLIGFGAAAVNPYLAMESAEDLVLQGVIQGITPEKAVRNLIKALGKGVLKVMSKMGISTIASYTGAQVFEAIGLSQELIHQYFTGTTSKLGGVGIDVIAKETIARHHIAYPPMGEVPGNVKLPIGGEYQWRRDGEPHLFDPETVFTLQHSTREKKYEVFKRYTSRVDDQSKALMTLRGLFSFKDRTPISLEEVEPISEIVKRFSTGAMSYGSISQEAHETLAIAMNRLGAKSNTGEGGEDPSRYIPLPNGDSKRSAIKQVASGRFGVTSEYLVNADDIQIKMAQGAKPGEGGQLPGNKVYPWIAKVRYSTPGVGLISPPPHHDIYSIEDLAQLIHDLKNANRDARIHVKLVAEVGVGTVAAGVSKAHADVVLISGHDGGTGASPLTSLKHAGAPWELGLAETQQTLVLNGLRDRIVVQADGQMKTGRDVMIAALLGAEEFGFATAPLVVSGCVMMRVCHLDTCPVGVATQNPELRARFTGKPEFVQTFFEYVAQEVRELLAQLGFRSLDEAIGQVEILETNAAINHWKAHGLDLTPILTFPVVDPDAPRKHLISQEHGLEKALDNELIQLAEEALIGGKAVRIALPIANRNRTVGTMLGSEITKKFGSNGLPDDTIDITFHGSAGQSLAAFIPKGLTIRLYGDVNDYLGKGISGGRVIVRPDERAKFESHLNVIAGNVIGYGGTTGEIFVRGVVGERFCVRNSGATAVAEGVGDHGCEYMTGGTVIVLGPTGRNFAAGMSGGIAYLLDAEREFVNTEMVDLLTLSAADSQRVEEILSRFEAETGSQIAQALLKDWKKSSERFTKVMPRDYARVLKVIESAEKEGRSVESAIMEVLNG
jgi:glutamate synthase (NADPH/NADH) large chain